MKYAQILILTVFLVASACGADNLMTLIDYPEASGTWAWGINSRGDIVGYYTGADKNNHGFLLNGGHYTAIDYPGAAITIVHGINPQGDVVGEFGATAASPTAAGAVSTRLSTFPARLQPRSLASMRAARLRECIRWRMAPGIPSCGRRNYQDRLSRGESRKELALKERK